MSNEIISGFNLSFDQGIAQNIGIDAAIIFNHILYWLKINAAKPNAEQIEGRYWMYETQKEMSEFFCFFSEDQISRALKKLVDCGLIIKKCLDKNPFNRINYYTVRDQSIIKKSLRNPENCGFSTFEPAGSDALKSAGSETLKSAGCIKEEKQDYKKEQQQPDSRVVPSDQEKMQAMQMVNLSDGLKKRALRYSLDEIQAAIQCILNSTKAIDNLDGYFASAIAEKWQPNASKFEKNEAERLKEEQEEQAKQKRQHEAQKEKKRIFDEAKKLESAYKNQMTDEYRFVVTEHGISTRVQIQGYAEKIMDNRPLTQESLNNLINYINNHLRM